VAEALPFLSRRFDYAVMVTTICFLDNIVQSLIEANRILKPGGRFITGFIDRNSPLGKTYQKQKHKNVFYREATFLSVDQVISFLSKARFSNPDFIQTLFHPLDGMTGIEPLKDGYGEGSFVVITAEKS
jgi:ubiquinone/menaquinone biosynthesis C-methylase UbiE